MSRCWHGGCTWAVSGVVLKDEAQVADLTGIGVLGRPLALGDVELARDGGQLALLLGLAGVNRRVLDLLSIHQPGDLNVTWGVVGDEAQKMDGGMGVTAGVTGGVEELHGGWGKVGGTHWGQK